MTDGVEVVQMTVKLKSGRFESSIEMPLNGTEDEMHSFVMAWLTLMETGLRVGTSTEAQPGASSP